MKNLNTILFDLDGTLLPLDPDKFTEIYFEEMGKYFIDLIDPEKLVKAVWDSTKDVIYNTEKRTNEDVFMTSFEKRIEGNLEDYKDRFEKFYDTKFIETKEAVFENISIRKSVDILKEKGYNLVVATNPLFPYKAILKRIEWAGLNPNDFSLITSYEKNHFCKPQIEFYSEILEKLGKTPGECMMVGNDVQEDLIVRKLGIKTFLIKDHILHRTDEEIEADYIGNYKDFNGFVKNLKNLK